MDAPTLRSGPPCRLLRACQHSRLERQLMSDAYECLVPILRCRCEQAGGRTDRWPAVRDRQVARACCMGGGL
jgi:hypothetical protein